MRKIYLSLVCLVAGVTVNAQTVKQSTSHHLSKNTNSVAKKSSAKPSTEKVAGDILFQNDFSTSSDWVQSTGAAHVGATGKWGIASALTQSLIDQSVAGKNFPTVFNSTSGGNFGFVDSDGAGSAGIQDAYFTYTGAIDLSALTVGTSITLEFDNIFRHFQETYFVEFSNDNGVTWVPIQINATVPVNENSGDPSHVLINVASANIAGFAQVQIRFHYVGNYDWFWAVDDVSLRETFVNDGYMDYSFMGTDTATTQGCDYYLIPTSQVSFPGQVFRTVASNIGTQTQTNFQIHATSTGYDAMSGLGTVIGGNLAMNQTDTFHITTPFNPIIPGTYDVLVSTSLGTTDDYLTNDTTSFRGIVVGGNDYGRDNGVMTSYLTGFTANPLTAWYNYMNVFDNYSVGSILTYIPSVQPAGVQDFVHASVDKYDGATDTWSEVVLTTSVDIDPTMFGTWLRLNAVDGAVDLVPGLYRVNFHRAENADNTLRLGMAQASPEGTVGAILADGTTTGLADPNAIMIRLSSISTLGIEELSNNFDVTVYPNPASSVANVSFNLKDQSSVSVTVTDLSGKTVYSNNLGSTTSGSHNLTINTDAIANGVYMVTFVANGVVSTEKLVIRK